MELLVVLLMMAALFSFLIALIDPVKQIHKARDAQRESDLKQVINALDTYYNDNNCYPDPSSISFGNQLPNYMQQLPQDPNYANSGDSYIYVTDGTSCPQWNVLLAKLEIEPLSTTACPLKQMTNCFSQSLKDSGYNYCVLSGNVDCSIMNSYTVVMPTIVPQPTSAPTSIPTSAPKPTSTPTPTPTRVPPTPTPTPSGPTCTIYYANTGSMPSPCNNLGGDPSRQCTIHGGSYVCYSQPSSLTGGVCLGVPCGQ